MTLGLHEFARRLGGRLEDGEPDLALEALAAPLAATAGDVTFQLDANGVVNGAAAAVLVGESFAGRSPRPAIAVQDVRLALCRAASWLPVRRAVFAGAQTASVHPGARVSPHARIGTRVRIGEGTCVREGAVIEDGVTIGAYCEIGAGAHIASPAALGNRCRIGPGCAVGTDGFAFVMDQDRWQGLPRFGGVRIGDDVVMLAHTTVHAGVFGDTVIGERCVLDSQVLIGHDARLGPDCALAGQSAVAGAARLGRGCRIGGKCGVGEGVVIADNVTVTAMSMVTRSLPTPGARYASGWPAEESATWWRRVASLRRLSAFNDARAGVAGGARAEARTNGGRG